MQLWRTEFELDRINSGSWYHCLPIRYIIESEREILLQHTTLQQLLYSSCCKVVCCMVVRPGQ